MLFDPDIFLGRAFWRAKGAACPGWGEGSFFEAHWRQGDGSEFADAQVGRGLCPYQSCIALRGPQKPLLTSSGADVLTFPASSSGARRGRPVRGRGWGQQSRKSSLCQCRAWELLTPDASRKLSIIIHDFPHQLFDQLLANQPVLLRSQFCKCLCDGVDHFIRFTGIDFVRPAGCGDIRQGNRRSVRQSCSGDRGAPGSLAHLT